MNWNERGTGLHCADDADGRFRRIAGIDGGAVAGLALALGGGGARGLAHIGVIEVLLELGYKIDYISGCSMGALVGGASLKVDDFLGIINAA